MVDNPFASFEEAPINGTQTGGIHPLMLANKNKNFVERALDPNRASITNPDGSISTHKMAAEVDENGNWFVFPTIIEKDGNLIDLKDNFKAFDYAKETGELISFGKDKEAAINFGSGGYKKGLDAVFKKGFEKNVNPFAQFDEDFSAQIPITAEGLPLTEEQKLEEEAKFQERKQLKTEETVFDEPGVLQEAEGIFNKVVGTDLGIDKENYPEFHKYLGALTPLAHGGGAIIEGVGGGIGAGVSLAADFLGKMGLPNSDELKNDLLAMFLESPVALQGAAAKPPLMRGGARAKAVQKFTDPKAVGLAKDVAQTEELGIRVLTSDIKPPETFAAKWVQSTGEKIPVAGTGPLRAAQQEERVSAIGNTLKEFGADDAVHMTDNVMADLLKTREKEIKKYVTAKKEVFNKFETSGPVDVKNTVEAIDIEIAKMKGLGSEELIPVVEKFTDWKKAIQNQSINNVEELRKLWGQSFSSQDLITVKKASEKSLNNIYGALRDDIGGFIQQNGTAADYTKWRVANNKLSSMIGELDKSALKTALNKGDVTPEVVKGLLFSKKPSDIRALYKNLSPKGRSHARAAILNDVMNKSTVDDKISPQKFMTNLGKAQEQVGVFFKGAELEQIKGLERALRLTERASISAVNPLTGQQLTIPVLTAVLTDMLGGAGTALAAGGTLGGIARIYESKAVRDIFIKLSKTKVGSKEEAAMLQKLIASAQTYKRNQEQK